MGVRSQLRRRIQENVQFHLGRPIVGGRLARIWWVVAARAVASVVFGVAAVAWPRHTAHALVGLFATFALIDGGTALLASSQAGSRTRRWLALAGVSSVAAGLFALSA